MNRLGLVILMNPPVGEGKVPQEVAPGQIHGLSDVRLGMQDARPTPPRRKWPNGAYTVARIILLGGLGVATMGLALVGVGAIIWSIISTSKRLVAIAFAAEAHAPHNEFVLAFINCAEVILAATLPYLVVKALFHYINYSNQPQHSEWAERQLEGTKTFLFGLLLSLVTVELVSSLLSLGQSQFLLRTVGLMGCIIIIAVYIHTMHSKKRSREAADATVTRKN